MLVFILKLTRGLVVEDFFTVAKTCEFYSNHEVLPDFPQSSPKIPLFLYFPRKQQPVTAIK